MYSMQFKNLEDLLKSIKNYPETEPLLILIHGKDSQIFNFVSNYVEKEKFKNTPVEITILTGEQEDLNTFVNDLYNFSLFIPNRIFIIKQGHLVLKNLKNFIIKNLPSRTWLLIEYEDLFPKKLIQLSESQFFEYETKILYDNQIDSFIHSLAKKFNLLFSEEAITEIKYLFPPKESILRTAILNIAKTIKIEARKKENVQEPYYVTYEDIRNIFYPTSGWDIYKIIDACLNKDFQMFLIELEKYNPPEDNYYNLLKNFLIKIDELRKYKIAKHFNLSEKEILAYIQADHKPPFIQKKILLQLEKIYKNFTSEKIEKIYKIILEIAFAFRQNIEENYKKTIFTRKIIEVFFNE